MTDWSHGYHTESTYTHGYYGDLSPSHIEFILLVAGYEAPKKSELSYLELGFGQGVCLNMHAATHSGSFYGCDFNPEQARYASWLSEKSGSGAIAKEASFAELMADPEIPNVDMITLHGIYSWVHREQQEEIIEIARSKLNTGGVLYISYNSMPGWAAGRPTRDLMRMVYERSGVSDTRAEDSLDESFELMGKLDEMGALFYRKNPREARRIKTMQKKERSYLVHEYLNEAWYPFYFKDVAEDMARAKLSFAASSALMDHLDAFNLPQKAGDALAETPDTVMRETMRDFLTNQQFRRDIYTRGARRLNANEQRQRFLKQAVIRGPKANKKALEFETFRGKQTLQPEVVNAILARLGSAGPALPIETLFKEANPKAIKLPSFFTTILLMISQGILNPARPEKEISENRSKTHAFNRAVLSDNILPKTRIYFASPVTGGGVAMPLLSFHILRSVVLMNVPRASLVDHILETVGARAITIHGDDKKPLKGEAYKTALQKHADTFFERQLPYLKRMDVLSSLP